jgi:large subunit ribosomal protein L4
MSLTITVADPTDTNAGKSRTVALPAEIFDVPTNIPLIHQVVVAQLAAARQGTQSTKTRAEVRGGGRKPYRQKGTGRARQGSLRAPQYAGGGIAHGPKPRTYEQRTPKKMIAAALRCALSDRQRNDRVHVVSSLVEGDVASTRAASGLLSELTSAKKVLVVAERTDALTWQSLRNANGVHLIAPGQLNTYDVLISDDVVFTEEALGSFVTARTGAELVVEEGAAVKTTKAPAKKAPAKKAAAKAEPVEAETAADTAEDAKDYGPDSHLPLEDGSEPDGFPIKGNADSMLYHVPGTPFYDRTVAEVWFRTAEAAEAAGFELPPSQRDKADAADDADSAEEGN